MQILIVVGLLVVVSAQHDRITRTVTAPTCPSGQTGCSLTATDEINNNQARQTNISVVRVDTTGAKIKVGFSYQGANVQNVLILPVSAAADITFVGVYEWDDLNSDNIPTDNEMSAFQAFSATNRNWQNGPYGVGTIASNMPFSTGLELTNLTIS